MTPFARSLRAAVQARGLSLREIRRRLHHRGYEIGVATLSLWQSGARRPQRGSLDVLRELEDILRLDDGTLEDALGPTRRIRVSQHVPIGELVPSLAGVPLAVEPESEMAERVAIAGAFLDAGGSIVRVVDRTLWQARWDGSRDATIFEIVGPSCTEAPAMRGTLGCEIVDVAFDPASQLVRATLRLHSPLYQGDIALTEREHIHPPQETPLQEFDLSVRQHQWGVAVFVDFHPERLPSRVRATISTADSTRSHALHLNGTCATHAETGFGPGTVVISWEW